MSEFDVRKDKTVTSIIFNDANSQDGVFVAYKITPWINKGIRLEDIEYDGDDIGYVVLTDKDQALNLIKALEKAVELGWLI